MKLFPKSSELNQKLFNLISAKISSNINSNAESKGSREILNRPQEKKFQMKLKVKLNHQELKAIN